ncbi:MAG: hypothetical protein ACREOZ_01955 [Gloeomargaritales cyanobacterium]
MGGILNSFVDDAWNSSVIKETTLHDMTDHTSSHNLLPNGLSPPGLVAPHNAPHYVLSSTTTSRDLHQQKMKAVEIKPFDGQHLNWKKWKKITIAAFQGCDWDKVLWDKQFADQNIKTNYLVYSQLQVAVADGAAAHIVDEFENHRDGFSAWQALLKWYDGENMRHDTGIDLRQKQLRLRLQPGGSAEEYINSYRNLQNQLVYVGQSQPEGDIITNFLTQITDQAYQSVKEYCRMSGIMKLEDAIFQVRKKEREMEQERLNNRIHRPFVNRPRKLKKANRITDAPGTSKGKKTF